MRQKRWSIVLLVVTAILFSSLSVYAEAGRVSASGTEYGSDTERNLLIASGTALLVGTILLVKTVKKYSHLKELYQQASQYGEEGKWDLAADTYAQITEIKANYKDVQAKSAAAKEQACAMFVAMGDDARGQEKYDAAIELYQKGLSYQPASIVAKSRRDQVAQDMVAVHYRLGFNYETQNRWTEAYDEYSQAYYYNAGYQDLESRYFRAKAKVAGNLPLWAILFLVNHTEQLGIERPLVQSLHDDLSQKISDQFYLMDDRHVQAIVTEQAAALSDTYDQKLAVDLGKVMGADQVLIGDILSVEIKGKRVRMEVELRLIEVESGELLKTYEYTHKFSKDLELSELTEYLPELTEKLAEKIMD